MKFWTRCRSMKNARQTVDNFLQNFSIPIFFFSTNIFLNATLVMIPFVAFNNEIISQLSIESIDELKCHTHKQYGSEIIRSVKWMVWCYVLGDEDIWEWFFNYARFVQFLLVQLRRWTCVSENVRAFSVPLLGFCKSKTSLPNAP